MRHVLIGGSGLTGACLARKLLARGARVLVVDLAPFPPDLVLPDSALPAGAAFEVLCADMTDPAALARIHLAPDDVVHHLAARQYDGKIPHKGRAAWFSTVNVEGTRQVLAWMAKAGATQMVFLSSDMVYGLPQNVPVCAGHDRCPLGGYGQSKRDAEDLCRAASEQGAKITILRPRLIVGPGRLGLLTKLFRLIELGLPVPMIGGGHNVYQMISVEDVADAMLAAVEKGLPCKAYNLGSDNPPCVRDLLGALIRHAGSSSFLIPTPGRAVKAVLAMLDAAGLTLMFPEQYGIADLTYLVDLSETKADLGWTPRFDDTQMLLAAYDAYRRKKTEGNKDG